jgi:uncharacterized protein
VPDIRLEELAEDERRRLLAERHLGRLAIPDFGGPMIFPVNYVFDRDLVVFRTDPGSKLDAAAERESVAFEVDAVEEATRTGWSVVVRGSLAEITDPAHLERLRALPLYPWREDPVRARAAAVDHRPPHQDPRRPALLLVGLTGRLPVRPAQR